MLVYVLNKHGRQLMPTTPVKARILLKNGKARVVKRTPFTIQLIYGSSGYTQPVSLGMDAGSEHVGLSAVTDKKELFAAQAQLRTDIVHIFIRFILFYSIFYQNILIFKKIHFTLDKCY